MSIIHYQNNEYYITLLYNNNYIFISFFNLRTHDVYKNTFSPEKITLLELDVFFEFIKNCFDTVPEYSLDIQHDKNENKLILLFNYEAGLFVIKHRLVLHNNETKFRNKLNKYEEHYTNLQNDYNKLNQENKFLQNEINELINSKYKKIKYLCKNK